MLSLRAKYYLNSYFWYVMEDIEKDGSFLKGFVEIMYRFYSEIIRFLGRLANNCEYIHIQYGLFGMKSAKEGVMKLITPGILFI